MANRLRLPRDLADEVSAELRAARTQAARDEVRVRSLETLLDTVHGVTRELGRPATPLDLLTVSDPRELTRRRRLLAALRTVDEARQRPDTQS
jgi:hypothetical protein